MGQQHMQFINNNGYLNKKNLLIAATVVFLLTFSVLIFLNSKEADTVETNEYYDHASGETVSDPEGKTPEKFGVNDPRPLYLGFSNLLETGISKYQVEATEIGFDLFAEQQNNTVKEVSIFVDTINRESFDSDSPNRVRRVSFDVLINRKDTYQATLEYTNITSVELILRDNNKEIFRSDIIDPLEYDHHDDDDH